MTLTAHTAKAKSVSSTPIIGEDPLDLVTNIADKQSSPPILKTASASEIIPIIPRSIIEGIFHEDPFRRSQIFLYTEAPAQNSQWQTLHG